MSKIENNFNSGYECKTLLTICLTENTKSFGMKKVLKVQEIHNYQTSESFAMVDIRVYQNEKPTKTGVSFTPYEFDWIANKLLYPQTTDDYLVGKLASKRKVGVKPKPRGFDLVQEVRQEHERRIYLSKKEANKIVQNYGSFCDFLEEIEDTEDGKE